MALIKCPDCGEPASKKASNCPKCGHPFKKKSRKTSLLTILAVIAIGAYISTDTNSPRPTKKAPAEPPKPLTTEDKIANQFSAWNGSHRVLERYIKDNLNDPGSYEHVSTSYHVEGEKLVVLTKFRANNKFGALVLNQVLAETSVDGGSMKVLTWQ